VAGGLRAAWACGVAGRLSTPHGEVLTPAFIFCATKASIKGITPRQLRDANTQFILSNTYHLLLQVAVPPVCVCVCVCMCVCVRRCGCMYVCMHACMYVCMYVCVCA
jgi:hypothetical protein